MGSHYKQTQFFYKFCDIQQLTNIVEVFNAELGNGLMSTQDNSKLLKNSLLANFFFISLLKIKRAIESFLAIVISHPFNVSSNSAIIFGIFGIMSYVIKKL